MKLFAGTGSATLTGGSAPGAAVATAAKRTWNVVTGPLRGYLQREAAYRELSDLDDRMLSDIGLNRSDVYAVASGLRRTTGGLGKAALRPKA
jgi:uncharacterized protein YjiS (DUF1127 family)